MEERECARLFEQIFPFWEKVSVEDREMLCRHTFSAHYQKGENVHGGSGECTGGILVKSGYLRVYLLSEEGKEVTLYRLYPGEICMLSASCVLTAVTFDVFVDAEEDSDCYIIGGQAFARLTEKNVWAENYALNLAVSRFSDVMWAMQQILFMSFDRRLAIFLYDETVKSKSLTVSMTHEQIARYMGSAREVVSRMLKYFASEGIVELSRGGVKILDKERLRRITQK